MSVVLPSNPEERKKVIVNSIRGKQSTYKVAGQTYILVPGKEKLSRQQPRTAKKS
jgi:hypothetical protein